MSGEHRSQRKREREARKAEKRLALLRREVAEERGGLPEGQRQQAAGGKLRERTGRP